MLDETLLVWSGEFGRTPYEQNLTMDKDPKTNYGRDHNPYGFTTLLAGGGITGGIVHGKTDDYSYRVVKTKSTSTTCTPQSCTSWA